VLCVGSQFVAMVLAGHYEIVLDLDGSMHSTRVPNCWSLLDNIPGFYVRRQHRTVLIRTPCGYIIDGLRYPPNRPVTVDEAPSSSRSFRCCSVGCAIRNTSCIWGFLVLLKY